MEGRKEMSYFLTHSVRLPKVGGWLSVPISKGSKNGFKNRTDWLLQFFFFREEKNEREVESGVGGNYNSSSRPLSPPSLLLSAVKNQPASLFFSFFSSLLLPSCLLVGLSSLPRTT